MTIKHQSSISSHTDENPISNIILFEEGDWRLYNHFEDEYSTIAHKCPKWAVKGHWGDGKNSPEWRWFWGRDDCHNCLNPVPENVIGLWTLHNWDRI